MASSGNVNAAASILHSIAPPFYGDGNATAAAADRAASNSNYTLGDMILEPITGNRQLEVNKELLDYQNKLAAESSAAANAATWEREDTALDRYVAAMKRNGFNPYAIIANGGGIGNIVGSSSANKADVGSYSWAGPKKDLIGSAVSTATQAIGVFAILSKLFGA